MDRFYFRINIPKPVLVQDKNMAQVYEITDQKDQSISNVDNPALGMLKSKKHHTCKINFHKSEVQLSFFTYHLLS